MKKALMYYNTEKTVERYDGQNVTLVKELDTPEEAHNYAKRLAQKTAKRHNGSVIYMPCEKFIKGIWIINPQEGSQDRIAKRIVIHDQKFVDQFNGKRYKTLKVFNDSLDARLFAKKVAEKYAKRHDLNTLYIPDKDWRCGRWVIY